MRVVSWLGSLIFFLGIVVMSVSGASDSNPAPRLRGPDFVLEKVSSWVERSGAASELVLGDGSSWKLKPGTEQYDMMREAIAAAIRTKSELFVSGDKSSGDVESVLDTQRLAVQQIRGKERDGSHVVLFEGPPSAYYLRADRPWVNQVLSLLRSSASSGASFGSPDLIVAIDPAHSEIVAVKSIHSGKPGP
jgi:hypothetical protein